MSSGTSFSPRPEAHPMKWDDLMPPVRHAVRDLLVRIQGAEEAREKFGKTDDKMEFGNCFLVYGTRGTGKTTVLLSAKEAACRECDYFEETGYGKAIRATLDKTSNRQESVLKTAAEAAGKALHNNLVWLDRLDLEPLPSEANLLATLLTCVSNALDCCGERNKTTALTSLFEEGADSARRQLSQLINAATLMWENIKEPDTRSIANRQVAAAEIYAKFRVDFGKAMDELSLELGRLHGLQDKGCSILLPIDNIDRSTDHLQSIVKLAQMVSHRRLWLVMAGDRVEVDIFLERAYWKELIHSHDGVDAKGKAGFRGEDEALVMARRQASSTALKLWPATHRVEVHMMRPKESLAFYPPGHGNTRESIRELLGKVVVPTSGRQRRDEGGGDKPPIYLIDFFDMHGKLPVFPKAVNSFSKHEPVLTRAAEHGLNLPARCVLDLWQITHWVVSNSVAYTIDFRAEKIARTMLRNAIASSKMPSTIGQHLQEEIIRRREGGETVLYFELEGPELSLMEMTMPVRDLRPCRNDTLPEYLIRSTISVRTVEDVILVLEWEHLPDIEAKSEKQPTELPSVVAAWLSVLYDILLSAEAEIASAVINCPNEFSPNIITIQHEVVTKSFRRKKIKLCADRWPTPKFGIFLAYDVFRQRWLRFRKPIFVKKDDEALLPRLLAAGWVACALDTFDVMASNKTGVWVEYFLKSIMQDATVDADFIRDFEKQVMRAATDLYFNVKQEIDSTLYQREKLQALNNHRLKICMIDWLECELPYLLSYWYVPVNAGSSSSRCEELVNDMREYLKDRGAGPNLTACWEMNSPFILERLEEQISQALEGQISQATPAEDESQSSSTEDYLIGRLLDGPFGDLHRLWQNEGGQESP